MTRIIQWVAVVAGIVAIAGCGATVPGGTPTTSPTATPTATPIPTPTPTPNLIPAAAAAYLAAANTINAGYKALNKAFPASMTTKQAKRYWAQAEKLDRTFLTSIFAIAYPAFMKADVDAQIAIQTKVVEDDATLAANPNDTAAYHADIADSTTESGTANIVRHDLGLPQIPLT